MSRHFTTMPQHPVLRRPSARLRIRTTQRPHTTEPPRSRRRGLLVVLKGAHADVLPESSKLLSEEERVSWSETAGLWPEDVRAAYRLPAEALPKLLADCSGIYAFTLSAPVKEAAECIILLAAED